MSSRSPWQLASNTSNRRRVPSRWAGEGCFSDQGTRKGTKVSVECPRDHPKAAQHVPDVGAICPRLTAAVPSAVQVCERSKESVKLPGSSSDGYTASKLVGNSPNVKRASVGYQE